MAMSYGNVYVASVAMGAKDEHTLKAFLEAEAYDGPSLIIAYSHCIAHGINMTTAMTDQKVAVESGQWLLYRYNPDRSCLGENPLILDSRTPEPQSERLSCSSRPVSRCCKRASRKTPSGCGKRRSRMSETRYPLLRVPGATQVRTEPGSDGETRRSQLGCGVASSRLSSVAKALHSLD